MNEVKLKFTVIKIGLGLSLVLTFLSGVLFLIKSRLADQTMVSLVLILILTAIYWFFMLRCSVCKAHLYSEKPCDNCGHDPFDSSIV